METNDSHGGARSRIRSRLFDRIDGSAIAVFRIGFGLTMLWEVVRYFKYNRILTHYIRPDYRVPYDFFEWVQPWPGEGLFVHFAVLATLAEVSAAHAAGVPVVPANVNLSLMSRAEPGRLVGRGRVIKLGRRLAVVEGEVIQGDRLVAKATVTFAVMN